MRNTRLLDAFLKIVDGFSDTDLTFLLSEVVLTYMAVNSCNSVIEWISEMFHNCVLTVYEQINPYDAFGQVMCSHFKKLGSPLKCLAKYPFEKDQTGRYKRAGFKDSFSIKASDFYIYNTSNEEKRRIDQLELFDEYEPWHQKCSHYTIISSTRGETLTNLISTLYDKVNKIPALLERNQNLTYIEEPESVVVKTKPFGIKFGVRYGHRLCQVGQKLMVFGGFGENVSDQSGKHMRHRTIEVVDLKDMSLNVYNTVENGNDFLQD